MLALYRRSGRLPLFPKEDNRSTAEEGTRRGRLSGNGQAQKELSFTGNALGTISWSTPSGSEQNSQGKGDLSFQFAQDRAIDPMLGFPAW